MPSEKISISPMDLLIDMQGRAEVEKLRYRVQDLEEKIIALTELLEISFKVVPTKSSGFKAVKGV